MKDRSDSAPDDARTPAQSNRGTNQGAMREANERLILTLLRREAHLPKAEIARRTGLSAQTVSRLISALEADDLILRGKPRKGRIGQPSVPLSLNPEGAIFLGMKVGRRSVEMIACNFLGQIVARDKLAYDYPDYDRVLEFGRSAPARLRDGLSAKLSQKITGLGIAMPFFLWNWAGQIGVDAAKMADWKHRDLRAEIADAVDLPVFLQNDATSACSAEIVFGTSTLAANTLCFFVAFFIGGGLAIRNALYTGTTGNAAGFGPLRVSDLDGGTRPLIELASLSALEKALQSEGHDTSEMWSVPEAWEFPVDFVDRWLKQASHALAQAIHASQTILDLETVLIDGWMPRDMARELTRRTDRCLSDMDMTGMHRPDVVAGTLGADARLLGAASLPLSHRYLVG